MAAPPGVNAQNIDRVQVVQHLNQAIVHVVALEDSVKIARESSVVGTYNQSSNDLQAALQNVYAAKRNLLGALGSLLQIQANEGIEDELKDNYINHNNNIISNNKNHDKRGKDSKYHDKHGKDSKYHDKHDKDSKYHDKHDKYDKNECRSRKHRRHQYDSSD